MKIQSRLIIVVIITGIITFMSVYLLSNTVLKWSFENIESQDVAKTAKTINFELDEHIEYLDNSVKDWANCDET